MLGLDPGKKALFTAFCIDKNRLSNLFDDVINISSDIQMNENTVIEETESKRQKRRKNGNVLDHQDACVLKKLN